MISNSLSLKLCWIGCLVLHGLSLCSVIDLIDSRALHD